MIAEAIKLISIFLLTMLKFIFGPTLGYGAGFPYLTTVAVTVAGMMSSVFLFTFLGELMRQKILVPFFGKKPRFTKRKRRFVTIWKKYGIKGIAFLTPLLLTPIGGTIILTSYHTSKRKIILYMFMSAVFWAFVLSGVVYVFGPKALPNFTP
jgi:hypothetical protein